MKKFTDKLIKAIREKGNPICVGLDPRLDRIPENVKNVYLNRKELSHMQAAAEIIISFNKEIIDNVADLVPAVKPQIAFYEIFGHEGMRAYEETLRYAKKKGLITIADIKRSDIGTTAEAYAKAFLGEVEMFEGTDNEVVAPIFDADAVTVNPYLGWDGVKPFIEEAEKYDKGIFVLVKTSNQSGGDLQDLEMADGRTIYEIMGHFVDGWGYDYIADNGYSFVGAVVGATYPDQSKRLREIMPNAFFLVPGYGAQGATAEDIKHCFNEDGLGALINSSRAIIYAYENLDSFGPASYGQAARAAVLEMKEDLQKVLG